MGVKLLIIGYGSIGRHVAERVREWKPLEKIMVHDKKRDVAGDVESLGNKFQYVSDVVIAIKSADIVLEAASQQAVWDYLPVCIREGKTVIVMSVGALLKDNFLNQILGMIEDMKNAGKSPGHLYIPSGAIGGVDCIYAGSMSKVYEIDLVTVKNPRSFAGNNYVRSLGINLDDISEPVVLYEGNVKDAVRYFPRNINVAATLMLASGGCRNIRVRIIADPKIENNRHKIAVRGEFGKVTVNLENTPSPKNPRTSYLAALSALATLRKAIEEVKIGT